MNKNLSGGLFTKKPKALEIKETPLSAQLAQYLNTQKVYHDRLNSGKVNVVKKYFCRKTNQWKEFSNWLWLCKEGTPDRYFLLPLKIGDLVFAVTCYVEVKTRGKKPTPEQLARHQELRESGAIVIIADSLDSFIEQFKEAKNKINSLFLRNI